MARILRRLVRKIASGAALALFPVRIPEGYAGPGLWRTSHLGFPILGALAIGGSLIGAGIAARRNKQANQQIGQLQAQNTGHINQFRDRYGSTFDSATQQAGQGAGLYADAMGINGPQGHARATGAFQAGPGYQWGVDEAMRGMTRAASAGGMLASGNTMDAGVRLAHGLANQEYGSWLDRLAPYNSLHMQGLENQAGIGSLITTAYLNNNQNQADRLQAQVNNRQGIIGNLLGFAGNVAGRVGGGGFGIFGAR